MSEIRDIIQYPVLEPKEGLPRFYFPPGGCPEHRYAVLLTVHIERGRFEYLRTSLKIQKLVTHIVADKCVKCATLLEKTRASAAAFEPKLSIKSRDLPQFDRRR